MVAVDRSTANATVFHPITTPRAKISTVRTAEAWWWLTPALPTVNAHISSMVNYARNLVSASMEDKFRQMALVSVRLAITVFNVINSLVFMATCSTRQFQVMKILRYTVIPPNVITAICPHLSRLIVQRVAVLTATVSVATRETRVTLLITVSMAELCAMAIVPALMDSVEICVKSIIIVQMDILI